jgi:hypothetical protein
MYTEFCTAHAQILGKPNSYCIGGLGVIWDMQHLALHLLLPSINDRYLLNLQYTMHAVKPTADLSVNADRKRSWSCWSSAFIWSTLTKKLNTDILTIATSSIILSSHEKLCGIPAPVFKEIYTAWPDSQALSLFGSAAGSEPKNTNACDNSLDKKVYQFATR